MIESRVNEFITYISDPNLSSSHPVGVVTTTNTIIDDADPESIDLYAYKWVRRYLEGLTTSSTSLSLQEQTNMLSEYQDSSNNEHNIPDDSSEVIISEDQMASYIASREEIERNTKSSANLRLLKAKLKNKLKVDKKSRSRSI